MSIGYFCLVWHAWYNGSMRRFLLAASLIFLFGFVGWHVFLNRSTQKTIPSKAPAKVQNSFQSEPSTNPLQQTLFVPYWTLGTRPLPTTYTTLAYFGISANAHGIDTTDAGYTNLPLFVSLTQKDQQTVLVVRLLDQQENNDILQDTYVQQKIIDQSIALAQKYTFQGIALDFEYKALAFDSVVGSITHFSTNFAKAAHAAHLLYYQTLYGDTFYRARPFAVSVIGKASDGIYVMAYDFHKTTGNPGPNFPLHEMTDEEYSFTKMIQDYTNNIPPQKITVVFGLFGYDWPVDEKGRSTDVGNSITLSEAKHKFGSSCHKCVSKRDPTAAETKVLYTDSSGVLHEVWFDDMQSIAKKEEIVRNSGIHSVGLWAYSYF